MCGIFVTDKLVFNTAKKENTIVSLAYDKTRKRDSNPKPLFLNVGDNEEDEDLKRLVGN